MNILNRDFSTATTITNKILSRINLENIINTDHKQNTSICTFGSFS